MNYLFNYWPLFTSLGFTVPLPACFFLTSITCPALTYLPVHLFRASFAPHPLTRSSLARLSISTRQGKRSWKWEDWEKLKRKGGCACTPVRWHMCIWLEMRPSVSCIWCMFLFASEARSCMVHMPNSFSFFSFFITLGLQTCPHLCTLIKKERYISWQPRLASSLALCMCVCVCARTCVYV